MGAGRRIAAAVTAVAAAAAVAAAPAQAADTSGCDPLDPSVCLYPFPNDHFTRPSTATKTGRALDLQRAEMPRNRLGVPIAPADYNRFDGFSPGEPIELHVPGLTSQAALEATGAAPVTDIARYADPDAPVVVINAKTGERQPIFVEVDANAHRPADRALIIRPAVNFDEGARYIVALRNLKRADGTPIEPRRAFLLYRDSIHTTRAAVELRRPHMESILATLAANGIARDDLYVAWDFTVASRQSLTGRMLSIRDRAFAQLGDTALANLRVEGRSPTFLVTGVRNFKPCGDAGCAGDESDQIARRVEGQVEVPCFLNLPGCPPGSRYAFGAAGSLVPLRIPGNVALAPFVCNIPRSVVAGPGVHPALPSLYGHGLLGSADEVNSGKLYSLGYDHGFLFCATDWSGMSESDLPNVLTVLQDLSQFPTIADRLQQGMLNFLFLGRAMIHPNGFAANPAFRFDGQSVIDTRRLYYDGGSQGGIMGGALSAVAPDFTRAALGVPGMNYSTLLHRSVDFDAYAHGEFTDGVDTPLGLYDAYPDELERPLIMALIQMLWDRGEPDGYAHHITADPLPNTPLHTVLLHEAFGDHQVANVATEVEARTLGAAIREPALDPGRSLDVDPFWGIAPIPLLPYTGSALVVWDVGPLRRVDGEVKGTTPPPPYDVPNRAGVDPHGPDASETPEGRRQIAEFLKTGAVVEVCDDHPCYLDGYTGP